MSSGVLWKGTKGPQLMRDEWQFDPNVGWNVEREWSGEKSVILGYVHAFSLQRIRTRHRHDGPLHYVTAFYTYPDNSSLFTEKWSANSTDLEQDIFRHPGINAWMESRLIPGQEWRKAIEDAIQTGEKVDTSIIPAGDEIAQQVLLEMRRGVVSVAVEYLTVTRTRIVPRQFGTTMVLYPKSYVFSPAQMPFPRDINFSIGDLPAAPVQTVWGFRRTGQHCDWASDRIEMSVEFTLADWSTLLYSPSPVAFQG